LFSFAESSDLTKWPVHRGPVSLSQQTSFGEKLLELCMYNTYLEQTPFGRNVIIKAKVVNKSFVLTPKNYEKAITERKFWVW
jgi:hypothetical protein